MTDQHTVDELLLMVMSEIDRQKPESVTLPTKTIRAIAQHTLAMRAGIREVIESPYLSMDEREALQKLLQEPK